MKEVKEHIDGVTDCVHCLGNPSLQSLPFIATSATAVHGHRPPPPHTHTTQRSSDFSLPGSEEFNDSTGALCKTKRGEWGL